MCRGERLLSRGAGCQHGLGAGFGQGGSEASRGCGICLLCRELPGCGMEKYSGAWPCFGLGGWSGPPASARRCGTLGTAGLGGSPQGSGMSRGGPGAGIWWVSTDIPRVPSPDFCFRAVVVCRSGKPQAGSGRRGCAASGFAVEMGSRLHSLPAASLNPRRGLEAVEPPAHGHAASPAPQPPGEGVQGAVGCCRTHGGERHPINICYYVS